MKIPIKALLIVLLIFNFSCSDKTESVAADETQGAFVHSVYFWLKNPTSNSDKDAFLKSLESFINQSPNISSKHIGVPSIRERDVVEASYNFSLILSFKDKAAHDRYQVEDAHQVFRDEIGPLVERFIVYDSEQLQ